MKAARLLRWYPRAWRERYGEELLALIQDTADEGRPVWRLRLGVAWGGLRERGWQAARAGRTAGKPLTGFGLLMILLAGINVAGLPYYLTDSQQPAQGWQAAALDGLLAGVALTFAVVLAEGLVALPALIRFLRAGGWPKIRRRVAWAAGATVVAGGWLAGVAVVAGSHPGNQQVSVAFGVALAAAFLAAGLAVAVAIGLWAIAAAAAARHLTLTPRVRSAQLMLGAVLPSALMAMLVALSIWLAVTQAPAWLIAVPVQLGGAVMYARQRLRVATRAGRGLRAAARAGLYPRVATRSLRGGNMTITIYTQATDQASKDALRRMFAARTQEDTSPCRGQD